MADERRNKWRNRVALKHSNEPAAILGNEWGMASAAQSTQM
jgi:hypothetical protein